MGNINRIIVLTFRICLLVSTTIILCQKPMIFRMVNDDLYDSIEYNISRPSQTASLRTKTGVATTPTKNATTKGKTFTPCPTEFSKLVWFKGGSSHKLYEPVYRAFHSRGYSRTRFVDRAHFLWMDQPNHPQGFYETLQPWQRFNQLPNTNKWDDKDEMALHMNQYYSEKGIIPPLHSFPESYVLHLPEGLEAFRKRLLEENGGMDIPWVLKEPTTNQGKGIKILLPQSEDLRSIVDLLRRQTTGEGEEQESSGRGRFVVQKYICDEMTYGGRKLDVRVFWAVASVDPLIVLYHTQQNYVRIGHALYDESSLRKSTTKAHLTTHTFGSAETKATWDEFREFIENHVFGEKASHGDRFSKDGRKTKRESGILKTIDTILADPFLHVQNQMKTVIGHLADAYKNTTFHRRSMVAENGFTWHAADMIIDNNLDVYIIEGTDGPGKDEDYDFRIKMHDALLGTLVDIVEEIVYQQEEHGVIDISAMKEKGILGGYEVVYNDGWFMDYRYERLPQKGCIGSGSGSDTRVKTNISRSKKVNPSSLSRKVVPATFTALTKTTGNRKTFWMKSRTRRTSEPVARSFRRNGWTPVDRPEDAQVIYQADDPTEGYQGLARPWQWVSNFPSQNSFFGGEHRQYLDYSRESGRVCHPIVHKNRPLEVMVYWLVLGIDPLIVLFHDGFLYFSYSEDDENEFLELPALVGEKDIVWKGSWKVFEHYLNETHPTNLQFVKSNAAAAAISISLDPISHVRNQMKASVVTMAEGFSKHTKLQLNPQEEENENTTCSSFALFYALFQVDRNLNIFTMDASHSYIKGEDHAEIVSLHDELYGSAFRMLEYLNRTSVHKIGGENDQSDLLGDYEWLIRPDANVSNTSEWKFRYDWNFKAKECFE